MPTANTTILRSQKQSFTFELFDRDNNLDLVSAMTLTSSNTAVCQVAVDPTNNRRATITAQNPGSSNVTVNGSVAVPNPLVIAVTVQDTPNLGHVELVAFEPPVPK